MPGNNGKQDRTLRSTTGDEEDEIDPQLLAALRKAIKEELAPISKRLEKIEKNVKELAEFKVRLDAVETAMQNSSDMMDTLVRDTLPSVSTHLSSVAEGLALQTLKIDVHRRKWNLIIHGVKGAAGEREHITRDSMINFARNTLKAQNPVTSDLAACHRLSGASNAGTIVRFVDLSKRDQWLSGTKHLKGMQDVSVSPDLPPVLRSMKDELMKTRKSLDPDKKSKAKIRYLPGWPFIELKVGTDDPIHPKTTLASITKQVLGIDPRLDRTLIDDLSKFEHRVVPKATAKGKG